MTNRLHLLKQPYRDIAERWVAALRSGEYRQGVGILCSSYDYYCCLGVLTHLLGLPISKGVDSVLTPEARRASGLASDVGHYGSCFSLSELNDHGYTFNNIAYRIESVPVGLWRDECFESGRQPDEEGHSE